MTDVLGLIAMATSILYLCFGLPLQIIENYKRKSTQGLSFILIFLCSVTLVMWSLYAWVQDPIDWYILGANVPGFIFSVILLLQFKFYKSA